MISFLMLLMSLNLFFAGDNQGKEHDYHLSRCEMVYSASDQALQITMHIFIDDLELALEKEGHQKLYITDKREHPDTDSLLFIYLQDRISLIANGNSLKYNYIGKEPSSDLQAVWCYLEVEEFSPPRTMIVRNTLMLDLYDDQKNIVSVKVPGVKGGFYLMEKDRSEETIEFR